MLCGSPSGQNLHHLPLLLVVVVLVVVVAAGLCVLTQQHSLSPPVPHPGRQSCMSEVSLGILDLDNMQGTAGNRHDTFHELYLVCQ